MASPNPNLLLRLLAGAILLHEFLYVCNWGKDYLVRCVAPALGLKLNGLTHSLIHILLIIAAAWLCLTAKAELVLPIFLLLTLVIASFSIRLSNHLVVSWFCFLVLTIDLLRHGTITGTSEFGIQALVILTYACAAIHKLNRDYFTSNSSCGVRLLQFYFGDRLTDVRTKNLAIVAGIWGVVITEGIIPVLLLFERTRILGVFLAAFLQTLFGFARNAHFSLVMFAGLSFFLPPVPLSIATVLIASAVGIWLAWHFSMWKAYQSKELALVLHAAFAAVAVYIFVLASTSAGIRLDTFHQKELDWVVTSSVLVLFVLNALSPYYSSKTEFSLAMFSNMRPDRSAHFIFRKPRRREYNNEYVEILTMRGMPEPTSCPRASMSYRLLRALKQYEGRKYLKYFIIESIKNLRTQLATDFFVELTDGTKHFQLSSDTDFTQIKHRKLCLKPAVIPRDPSTPYCN